jgi:hypothetical protein
VGFAHSRAKPEKTKEGGSVPAAVLTLLGFIARFQLRHGGEPYTKPAATS